MTWPPSRARAERHRRPARQNRAAGRPRRDFMRQRVGSACAPGLPSSDAEVLELPGIVGIDVLREEDAAILQRRPIAIGTDDAPEIRQADLEHALEIHLVGLDDAGA